jgi:hypothetical protein
VSLERIHTFGVCTHVCAENPFGESTARFTNFLLGSLGVGAILTGKIDHKDVLFCWLCGCSFGLRICASGHKNPPWVQYCLTCGKDRSLMSRPHSTKELSFTPHPTRPYTYVPGRTRADRTIAWFAVCLGAAILWYMAFVIARTL